jgi:hypothetical protein
MPPLTAVQHFWQSVPLPFLHDTTRLLFESYRTAFDECRARPWQVSHDFRGHLRRSLIEERWPAVAERHADDGVRVSYQPNHARTSYYAQVVCGQVVLTQSCVETPETIVRRAEFRNTLARSNQPGLFGDDPPPIPTAPLFALLIHGEDHQRRHPYFADVVFPDPDGRCYLERICLFDLFHALVASLVQPAVPEEIIPDEANPQLRAQENRDA